MTKTDIRKRITTLSPGFQALELLSEQIVRNFQGLELFKQAQTVGVYIPLPDEPDITPLFALGSAGGVAPPEHSESKGRANSPSEPQIQREKTFYIPAFDETLGGYRLAEYNGELKKGKFGILEPACPVFAPEKLDLILVPGVAFDHAGHRIGRGGGFYDRLLPQYQAVRAGVCFDFQCLEKVPTHSHDCKMDFLVTELQIS